MARLREASMSASASLTDTQLLERAARRQLGLEALHEAQAMSTLTEEEAMRVADDELHTMRRERRRDLDD
ncbi:MAG: hypothetical protein WBC33_08265 [Conexibacter sp.]